MTPLTLRIARALHRAGLVVLPRSFRDEFGEELQECFEREAEATQHMRGRAAVFVLLARSLADTTRVALSERRVPRQRDPRRWTNDDRGMGGEMMGTVIRDAMVALRSFRRRPVFTVIAVGTLALGIGANVAIFSVVDAVLLRELPFPEADRLVRVYHVDDRSGNRRGGFSLPDREDFAARTTSLSGIAVYSTLPSGLLLTGGDEAIEIKTAYVSAGFFDVLGRDAYLGRVLLDSEERGDNRVVVLSHAFWQRRFGGDESIVGRTIQLDDDAFRVAGVMPADFAYPNRDVEAWTFLTTIPSTSIPLQIRGVRFLQAIGRIRAGTTREQALQELASVSRSVQADYPDQTKGLSEADLVSLRESMTGGVETALYVLFGAVGLVLLIACANVANLLFSRGLERGRELGVRRALGAGRGRLVRQLFTETVLLAAIGGGAGVALAVWGTSALLARSGGLLPRSEEIGTDPTVLGFAVLVTVATAMACGLLPALKLTRGGAEELGLVQRGAGSRSVAFSRISGVIVASQVTLAVLVVISSGLLLRSLWALQSVDVGMESGQLATVSLTINDARYPERAGFIEAYEALMSGLARLPEVESIASIRSLPLVGLGEQSGFSLPARPQVGEDAPVYTWLLQVSPGFFRTAGVPMLAGREFDDRDGPDALPVVMVNDAWRRAFWPGSTPIGEAIRIGSTELEIVGLVGDIRQDELGEDPLPTIYVPQAQDPRRSMAFVMRTAGDPERLLPNIRATVQSIDPDQPIDQLAAMDEVVRSSTARPRFFSILLASFAVLALLLSGFGIYGVVSHSVSRRTAEIGIRVALGAGDSGVVGMVVRSGMRPVLIGSVLGLAAAFGATRVLRAILYEVSELDPVTFAVVPVLLIGIAALACFVPARRATRVDPTEALRVE